MDNEYICLDCEDVFLIEKDLLTVVCRKCGTKEYFCPNCGGEVETVEEYNKNMQILHDDDIREEAWLMTEEEAE